MYLWVIFCSGVHRTQYRTPMNPQFANVGEVVVCHEIDRVKFKKKKIFFVKWLSMVYLKAVNYSLALRMQFTTNLGVLRPLKGKLGAKNSLKRHL